MSSGQDSGDVAGALDAYENAPSMMVACEGQEMVLASANEVARAALGEHFEFGRPVRDLAPGVVDQLRLQFGDDVVATVRATGRPVTRPACRVEVRAERHDPVEVFWDVTVSPWYADDGSMRGVLAHGVDVTDETRARHRAGQTVREVVSLQDALLPQWLPVLPGVEIAGRYLLAQREDSAGGDWYDAVGLGHGRVALMVGDVVGHGVSAAAVMGQLRAVIHERLTGGEDLHRAVVALDRFASHVPDASAATLCVVVLDSSSGHIEYCTAGHPPPLVVRPGIGWSRYLPHSGAAPLATTGDMSVAEDEVDCGDLIVLYTDGLMARPGRSLANTTVELGQLAVDAAASGAGSTTGPADRVCEQAMELTTARTGYADDIAVLVAEVTEPPAALQLDLPADEDAAPAVLDAFAEWLESMRVRDLDHIVVQHAVDELVSNVVDHAYGASPATPGRLTVEATLLDTGVLRISFADEGRWLEPRDDADAGRGLMLVRGMVDRLLVSRNDHGTVATIEHRLSRPARMLTGATTAAGRRHAFATDEPFTVTSDGDGSLLRCAGRLDAAHVDDLSGALVDAARSDRVVIDLSGVTLLSSAAVQALHGARRGAAERGQELVLHAPAGTTAQHVLELVRLPYALSKLEAKIRDVVGLYLNPPEKAIVLCVDEKSQIQALDRTAPILPLRPGLPEKATHDYKRNGTTTLFAALEVATGKVTDHCYDRHGKAEFERLPQEGCPRLPAPRAAHRASTTTTPTSTPRSTPGLRRHPRITLHFTPTSGSWLNLVEVFFGIITRQAIRRGSFANVKELVSAISNFIDGWNQRCHPFIWTKTADEILPHATRKRSSDARH